MNELGAAIISGLSALLGAAVGGFATYRAAARGAEGIRTAEHDRWTRERREDAYRTFLTARNRYVRAQIEKGNAMQNWSRSHETHKRRDAEPFDWDKHELPVSEALAEVERAAAMVEVFGSKAAQNAIRAWIPVLQTDIAMATRPGGAFGAAVLEVADEEAEKHRDPFVAIIRRELQVPN